MFNRFFIPLFVFINLSLNLYSDEKQLIIDRLIIINNITFTFEQTTNNKKETGLCILSFDNKLMCDYKNSSQKNIIMNDKTLVIQKKKYGKIYFYPILNSPFSKIFNKNNLINLVKNSDYQLNDNIELTYVGKNKERIKIFFEKDSYNIVGWSVVDQLQNIINFSIEIKHINSEINHKIFKIPSSIKE